MSLLDDVLGEGPSCEHCGGVLPCACSDNAQTPGSQLENNRLVVTFPIQTGGTAPVIDEDYFDLMLLRRGLNREDWEVERFKANEWDSLRANDFGVVRLSQTTVWFKPKIVFEETILGGFLAGLREIRGDAFRPLKQLKPVTGPIRYLMIGDHQAPFINKPFHELILEALSDIKPGGIIYMGDGVDFDTLTHHRAKAEVFTSTISEGLASLHRVLYELRDASGLDRDDLLVFLYGNHEDRLRKQINDKLPSLAQLRRPLSENELLSIEFLADFDAIGYEAVTDVAGNYPYGTFTVANGTDLQPPLLATHGWLSRKGAGASARASAEHLNASIVVGHTHRGAVVHFTRWTPTELALPSESSHRPITYTAVETGTVADLQGLGYTKWPDWQPLFMTAEVGVDGGYSIDAAVFDGQSLRWRDCVWTRTKTGVKRSL